MNIHMEYSKMRSKPSEHMWKTRVILIHLENYFGKCAQEVWERNWMNPDMHTMLLDTKLLNAMLFNMYKSNIDETILKALREQSKEGDQMRQEYVRLRSTAEQEEIDEEHSECVFEIVPMQDKVELHRRFLETSSWIQQARCLSQS